MTRAQAAKTVTDALAFMEHGYASSKRPRGEVRREREILQAFTDLLVTLLDPEGSYRRTHPQGRKARR